MSTGPATDNIGLWLHTNLERPWRGSHVAYSLKSDVLRHVVEQWSTLDSPAKLRLLTALLSIKPANLRTNQAELLNVTTLAGEDSDGWVQSMGQLISTALNPDFPHFNFPALEKNHDTATMLESIRAHCTPSSLWPFLSITALWDPIAAFFCPLPRQRHFAL